MVYERPSLQVDAAALPPPLTTAEPGSFAQHTFKVRVPHIIEDTRRYNQFPDDILAALAELETEITGGQIRALRERAPDTAFWAAVSQPFVGRSWLDVPWYWAEAYFYRRLLEATGYFQTGPGQAFDPFAAIKQTEWRPDGAARAVESMLAGLPAGKGEARPQGREAAGAGVVRAGTTGAARFAALLQASLWGNRIDLSYKAVARLGAGQSAAQVAGAHLLADDSEQAWDFLIARPPGQVIIVTDNAGTELAMDLALADHLLAAGLARVVSLHLKPQPFFVSDAMPADVGAALDALASAGAGSGTGQGAAALAARLRSAQAAGRLVLSTHWFYTSSLFYYELPDDLRAALAGARLVIVKGDANYRRLLGDAHWPPATPFAPFLAYFPAPLLALRTLKSEIIVGLQPGEAERLAGEDPSWLINGKRGVIQARL